jgi:hypothetical protein
MSGDYPIVVNEEGIKIKEEKMETEKLYHCVFDGKVFIFFKDDFGSLNCYEISDPDAVKEVQETPADIENILKKRADV